MPDVFIKKMSFEKWFVRNAPSKYVLTLGLNIKVKSKNPILRALDLGQKKIASMTLSYINLYLLDKSYLVDMAKLMKEWEKYFGKDVAIILPEEYL